MAVKFRILIVDDTKYVREHIKSILDDSFIVDTATSRDDAYKKFQIAEKQSFSYDVILLDNYLPERDEGIEVLEYIRDNKIDTIALMISSHTEIESEPFKTGIRAFKAGAVDFLPKPFRQDELKDKITRLVSKKQQAIAILEIAGQIGTENYREQLEEIVDDPEVDMITKVRVTRLLESGGIPEAGESSFFPEPRNIEVSGSSSKSHNNMWNKRINAISDIPSEPRNNIFKVIASHKKVQKIKFTKFQHSSTHNEYKIRMRSAINNSGQVLCSLYGPSPITVTQQDFIIYVETGNEQTVKEDLENRLAEFCRF